MNGRYDLINLFAARLDLKPFIDAWGSSVKFELSAYGEDTMRYCAVDVNPNEAGKIYTDDTFTKNADTPLHSAPLTALHYDGISINSAELLGEGNAPGDGIMMYPGEKEIWPSIRLAQCRDGVEDYEYLQLAAAKAGVAACDNVTRAIVRTRTDFSRSPEELRKARDLLSSIICSDAE